MVAIVIHVALHDKQFSIYIYVWPDSLLASLIGPIWTHVDHMNADSHINVYMFVDVRSNLLFKFVLVYDVELFVYLFVYSLFYLIF